MLQSNAKGTDLKEFLVQRQEQDDESVVEPCGKVRFRDLVHLNVLRTALVFVHRLAISELKLAAAATTRVFAAQDIE